MKDSIAKAMQAQAAQDTAEAVQELIKEVKGLSKEIQSLKAMLVPAETSPVVEEAEATAPVKAKTGKAKSE